MADDREEQNRVLGMPRGQDPYAPRQGEAKQYILGLPADWYGPVDREFFRSLRHPIKACRYWLRRRRLGPFALEEDDPGT